MTSKKAMAHSTGPMEKSMKVNGRMGSRMAKECTLLRAVKSAQASGKMASGLNGLMNNRILEMNSPRHSTRHLTTRENNEGSCYIILSE